MYSPLDVELNLNAVRGAPLERMWDVLRPDGVLVTVTGDVEHLDELVEVHRRCETGRVAGKLAVAPALPLSQDLEAPPSIPGWPLYLRRRREGGGQGKSSSGTDVQPRQRPSVPPIQQLRGAASVKGRGRGGANLHKCACTFVYPPEASTLTSGR